MILSLLIIHNRDRVSSITQVLLDAAWDYFPPVHFEKEAIITDVNDLVEEFWRTSSDGSVWELGASFFGMCRLFDILVCFDFIRLPSTLIIVRSRPEFRGGRKKRQI
jgi:hypothetical protein